MFVKKYTSDHAIREVSPRIAKLFSRFTLLFVSLIAFVLSRCSKATKMVKRIKEKLKSRIGQAQWLPSRMKMLLTQKLDNLGIQIGYPDWYKDDEAVTRYYDGVFVSKRL